MAPVITAVWQLKIIHQSVVYAAFHLCVPDSL